jgi:hypothetical protein
MDRSENVLKRLEQLSDSSGTRFQWHRKQGGYEIAKGFRSFGLEITDQDQKESFLTENAAARGKQPEWYDPAAEHVALFQEVARLDLSDESLLRFVNAWGLPHEPIRRFLLGNRQDLIKLTSKLTSREISRLEESGLPLDRTFVFYPFMSLGRGVRAWEALTSASSSQVRDLFRREAEGKWVYLDRGPIGDRQVALDRELGSLADHGDFPLILTRILQDLTNSWLSRACSPALLAEPNDGSFQLKMIPHDLIGFMWVQFAEAVAGGKEFRQCASCARWMEIAPGQGRPEKVYCSDACRMRAYRKRKANGDRRNGREAAVR